MLTPDTRTWRLLLPLALNGLANAFLWAPIGSTGTGTRNLPMALAGAGSGA